MTTITTNGCFDILHIGHLKLLETASSLGRLVVLINSDISVKKLKGDDRPLNNQEDRKKMLLAIKYVDEVIIFEHDELNNTLSGIKPDYHVKSVKGYKGLEKETIESHGGKILLIEDTEHSTTKMLK